MTPATRIADLTVAEFSTLMSTLIQNAIQEALAPQSPPRPSLIRPPLNLPLIDVGAWPEGLTLRREEIYGEAE